MAISLPLGIRPAGVIDREASITSLSLKVPTEFCSVI